jgi:Tol biopolymer transport system component/DNA-binding winged helix-turn-helix (wHTH) protein
VNGDFRIGRWLVEPTLNRISQNGASRHLEPKVMQVLVCLTKAQGQVVSKQQLIEEVWKGTFVTDDVLTRSISELREAFGDDARDSRIIQTIPKQGYRLLLPITHPAEGAKRVRYRSARKVRFATLALGLLVAGSWLAWRQSRQPTKTGDPSAMKITLLTHSGVAKMAQVTPDGKSFFYIKKEKGRNSIWLRQISTGSEAVILAPTAKQLSSLSISPDGSYLYFTESQPDLYAAIERGTLYVMPAFGGMPRKIAEDIQSPVAVSPDSTKIAFLRARSKEGAWDVIVANADGTQEEVVQRRREPRHYAWGTRMSWSPDGRSIAASGREHIKGELAIIDVANRTERVIRVQPWEGAIGDTTWLRDRSGIVLQGTADEHWQLWFVDLLSQSAHRITRDTADYYTVSLTSSGRDIITEQGHTATTIWSADYSNPMSARQISFSPKAGDGELGLCWTADSKIAYTSSESGNQDIWLLDPTSGGKQRLTTDPVRDRRPRCSSDGGYIVFVKWSDQAANIWRMDADGRNAIPLTDGDADFWPQISPDSKTVLFGSSRGGKRRIWKIPIEGGEAAMVADISARISFFSPDGKWIGIYSTEHEPGQTIIVNAQTGAHVQTVEGKYSAFTPDSKGLLFFEDYKGVRNIIVRPVSGVKPYSLTKFQEKGILGFDISPDGKKLAMVRGEEETDIVMISGFREGDSP